MSKCKKAKLKTIFSIRINHILRQHGFYPLFEDVNKERPQFKCWVYDATEDGFSELLDEIMQGGKNHVVS